MLTITKTAGIYKAKSGQQVLGQARTLSVLLENIAGQQYPEEFYWHAAEVLDPLIREQGGQIATGGMSA